MGARDYLHHQLAKSRDHASWPPQQSMHIHQCDKIWRSPMAFYLPHVNGIESDQCAVVRAASVKFSDGFRQERKRHSRTSSISASFLDFNRPPWGSLPFVRLQGP
ncbi:hypothetical protein Tco_0768232 [Tanacetum coccineum]